MSRLLADADRYQRIRHDSSRLALILWSGDVGGAETLTAELGAALRSHGVEATAVLSDRGGPLTSRLDALGVGYEILGLQRGRRLITRARSAVRSIERVGAGRVITVDAGLMPLALRLGGFKGIIVSVEHGSILNPPDDLFRRMLHSRMRRQGLRVSDAAVAVSEVVGKRLRMEIPRCSPVVIYNGVDTKRFRPAPRPAQIQPALVVGFVGTLRAGKGVESLIAAASQARKTVDLRLKIAGGGPLRPALERLASVSGLDQAVEFCGHVADVQRFWTDCDVAVVPSDDWIESFSMATLEAMACGKPVVASDAGALPELVVDRVTGRLVTPGKPDEIAGALRQYADDRDMLRWQSTRARERSERFTIEETAERYVALFEKCEREHKERPAPRLRGAGYGRRT